MLRFVTRRTLYTPVRYAPEQRWVDESVHPGLHDRLLGGRPRNRGLRLYWSEYGRHNE